MLRLSQLKRILGIDVDACRGAKDSRGAGKSDKIRAGWERAKALEVVPPSWRRDLTREIDLVEEVARIHGYDAIPEDVNVPMAASHRTQRDRVLEKIREVLISAGVDEAMTISLVEPNVAAVFSPWTDLPPLESSTPVLRRANRLRTSLIPSLLEARRNNEAIGNQRIELFEIARVYLPAKTGLPDERLMLGITSGGDFLAVKGLVEAIVERLNPSAVVEVADFEHSLFKTARACELKAAGKRIGFLGEVSAAALKSFELRQPTTVAELEIAALETLFQPVPRAVELSMYPAVSRDLNLVVAEQIRWDKLTATVRRAAGSALETIEFRDTYRDAKRLGTGKKSQLFTIVLRRNDATLTNVEADQVRDQIVAACQREHCAELRV